MPPTTKRTITPASMMIFHGELMITWGANPVLGSPGALPVFGRFGTGEFVVTVVVCEDPPPPLPKPLFILLPTLDGAGVVTGTGVDEVTND